MTIVYPAICQVNTATMAKRANCGSSSHGKKRLCRPVFSPIDLNASVKNELPDVPENEAADQVRHEQHRPRGVARAQPACDQQGERDAQHVDGDQRQHGKLDGVQGRPQEALIVQQPDIVVKADKHLGIRRNAVPAHERVADPDDKRDDDDGRKDEQQRPREQDVPTDVLPLVHADHSFPLE